LASNNDGGEGEETDFLLRHSFYRLNQPRIIAVFDSLCNRFLSVILCSMNCLVLLARGVVVLCFLSIMRSVHYIEKALYGQ
jgi:hypothetical protein